MTCPCGVCEIRHIGCHAQCDAYKAWNNERMAEREKIYKHNNRQDMLDGFKKDAIQKQRRKRR